MPKNMLHSNRRRTPETRAAAMLAVLLLCLGLALCTAAGADAHDQVISANPHAEQQLGTAPRQIELSFSGELMALGFEVLVVDANDRNWAQGDAAVDGTNLTQQLSTGLPDGEYRVRWRVVSSDGHPISGSYPFRVGAAAAPAPATAHQETALQQPSASIPPAQAADGPQSPAAGLPAWLAGVIGAAAGLGGYLAYLAFRRRASATRQ